MDIELLQVITMENDILERQHQIIINHNNPFDGSAPRKIEKIRTLQQLV
jgi:hypothetical protein